VSIKNEAEMIEWLDENEAEMIEWLKDFATRISISLNISLEEAVELVFELIQSVRAEPEKWKKALDIMEALRDNNIDYVYEKYKNDPDVVIGNLEGSSMPFHCIGMTESNHQVPNPSYSEPKQKKQYYGYVDCKEDGEIWAEIYQCDIVPRTCEYYGITQEEFYSNPWLAESKSFDKLVAKDYWAIMRVLFKNSRRFFELKSGKMS
jgi:hypothetical protein